MKKARQRAGTKETKKRNARETKEASQQWASLEEVRNVRAPFILCCCWLDGLLFVVGCRHRSHSCARNGEAGQQRVCTAHFCGHGRHISSIRRCAHLAQGKSCLYWCVYCILIIFLATQQGKSCRKKVYADMRLEQWNRLPRDAKGRKVMVSDQFKTANTYNVDTVLVLGVCIF
jgi:hypothetical protein